MQIRRRHVIAALGTLPLSRLAHGQVAHRMTLLHMNDFHSRHLPVDGSALNCAVPAEGAAAKEGCFGGAARLASAIAAERAAAERDGRTVLLLDAGDQFQGSLFYTAHKGDAELAVMHALGTAVMAVGNHEFDDGPANLARFVRAAKFPVVSATIDTSREPALDGLLKPFVTLDAGGLKIGIVGLTTTETATGSSPGPNITFLQPEAALATQAARARADGAQLIVALSHVGVDEDRALAGHVPGVALFIGGHSHTLLSNTERGASGTHPVVVDGPSGRGLVVQAAAYGRYLGRIDLDCAADGQILSFGGDCRHIGLDLPEDPTVAGIVATYAASLDALRRRVIAHSDTPLDLGACRISECALGDLVAEALLASVHGADVAVMNAGGLRTGLPAGDITMGDLMTMMPFGNTAATMQLRGADLVAAIGNGLARAGRGGFPQVAGLRIVWNPLAAEADRLVSLSVRTAEGSFVPVDPQRIYRVVTNNFLRSGGDGYVSFRDHAIAPYDAGPNLDTIVSEALARMRTPPGIDGRIALR